MSIGELWIYLGFFVVLVAAGLGFPAPEELVISGAGVLAGQSVAANGSPVRWWILLPVCIAGVVLSDMLLYSIGRRFGRRLLEHRWLARFLPRDRLRRTERNFHRYGVSILVFGRLMPGIRAPLFLTAGSMRLPLPRFLIADGIGAVVGNSCFFFLGFWLGDSVRSLIEHAEARLRAIVIITALGLITAYLLWHFLRHPVATGDPSEVPLIGPQVASHIEHAESAEKHTSLFRESAAEERHEVENQRERLR